jgi:hypothetical protein
MLSFGVTIPATVPQGSEIPEGLMNNPVLEKLQESSEEDLTKFNSRLEHEMVDSGNK